MNKAQADKNTRNAIKNAEAKIKALMKKRSKYSGRELRDIDDQIAQYRRTIAHFQTAKDY